MLAKHYLPAPVLLLPLASSSSSSPPTYITPCPSSPSPSSWTVTAFSLTDFATPNLITLRADLRRSLSFTISSSSSHLPKTPSYKCAIDTGYQKVEHIQQFDSWTRACWDAENFLVGPPDPAFAFKFVSAAGDLESAHPAEFSLSQELDCKSGEVEVQGTANITLSCAMPPDCGGPCFDRQCDGTTFVVHSGG